MMSAPLILACDTRNNDVHDIITNRELIALHQDDIMLQAKRVSIKGGIDILVKPLAHGEAAVCFFNKAGRKNKSARIDLSTLNELDNRVALPATDHYLVKNLWDAQPQFVETGRALHSGKLPRDDVAAFRVKAT